MNNGYNSRNQVPTHRLIERNGTTFEEDEDQPFSGFKMTYLDGVLYGTSQYKNGLLDGRSEVFYADGSILWSYVQEGIIVTNRFYGQDGIIVYRAPR